MKLDLIGDIFAKHVGAKREGGVFLMPAEMDVTVFVAMQGETLAVAKIVRLEITEPLLVADTARGDRVVFYGDDVRAVKLERGEGRGRDRHAGFSKP